MLILKAVSLKPCTLRRFAAHTPDLKGRVEIPKGPCIRSLPLEHHGLITAEWGQSENNRRRSITP